jgi:hypothetical protein
LKKFFINRKTRANRKTAKELNFSSKNIAFLLEEPTDATQIKKLFQDNFGNEYSLHFAVFSQQKLPEESPAYGFTKGAFSFFGSLKKESLQLLTQEKFLYVFNIFNTGNEYLNYLNSMLTCKLNIGLFSEKDSINDLTIKTSIEELDVFFKEAKNYLSLINKSS